MFANSTVGDVLGIGVIVLFGAYLHYRVATRRTQTRLAIGLLEEEDSAFVDELNTLIETGSIRPLAPAFSVARGSSRPSRKSPRRAVPT